MRLIGLCVQILEIACLVLALILLKRRGVTPVAVPGPAGTQLELPYVWGVYCGYVALLVVLLQILGWIMLGRGSWPSVKLGLLFIALSIAAGIGLLMRRRIGVLALFGLWLMGAVNIVIQVNWKAPANALAALWPIAIVLGLAIPSAVYFRKRWPALRW